MTKPQRILHLSIFLSYAWAEMVSVFPSLFMSYKLIPGLKPSLHHSEQMPFALLEAQQLVTRSLEQCLSDSYVILNIPGLCINDFGSFATFPHLRKYMTASSTILSMPNILTGGDNTLNLKNFENTLKVHCQVVKYEVNEFNENEVPDYIDIRKRFIMINISDQLINERETENRKEILGNVDELLWKILRKLPSPNVSILVTTNSYGLVDFEEISDEKGLVLPIDIPDDPKALSSELKEKIRSSIRMIFPDITIFDKSRYFDFERNDKGERISLGDLNDGAWAKDVDKVDRVKEDDTWLSKKEKRIVKENVLYKFGEDEDSNVIGSIWKNKKFILDNSLLILSALFIFLVFVMFDFLKLLVKSIQLLQVGSKKKPNVKNIKEN